MIKNSKIPDEFFHRQTGRHVLTCRPTPFRIESIGPRSFIWDKSPALSISPLLAQQRHSIHLLHSADSYLIIQNLVIETDICLPDWQQ